MYPEVLETQIIRVLCQRMCPLEFSAIVQILLRQKCETFHGGWDHACELILSMLVVTTRVGVLVSLRWCSPCEQHKNTMLGLG